MWLRREVAHQIHRLVIDKLGYANRHFDRLFEAFRRWIWKNLGRAPNVGWGDIEETLEDS